MKYARYLAIIPSILAFLAMGSAGAADIPKRKPGLWDMKMTSSHGDVGMEQCIDANTDNLMQQNAKPGKGTEKEKCTTKNFQRSGNKFSVESVCQIDGTTATTRATGSGAFDTGYRMTSHTTYNPPMHGMRETNMTIEAKWMGPCRPGQRPGDVSMKGMPGMPNMPAGMPKINLQDMMQGR